MTTTVDGRLQIKSLDELTIPEAIELLRRFDIQHIVWLTPLDRGLMAFAGNFGVTFQEGDGPSASHLASEKILVVG